ncbi:phosphoribosylglycinamide formyltransferase [Hippea maritima]|uniref:Phosphoribosylglycinamide formyltransferase n=1 Tax=Hippea maritima (strain ATCC 700847 / DSM 10411 / MH2) TaxID=760142 RepID=F2LUG0_HIPMA|nr:phosphoribosylglycinamide formyltransferase [Hippea maritima]AEA33486.1 phosphoribosylglycinamide formyltransferase [Hippea maritima DSM 10411]
MYRLGVLLSGRGSNFESILNAIKSGYIKNAEIVVVLSNKADARGLEKAKESGIDAFFINPNGLQREEYDKKLVSLLKGYSVDYVILAGYMRILSDYFIESFENKILNIHPALLPSFKGLHAQRQALEAGVRFAGATVHFVTKELDSGPIIVQSVVPVFDADTEGSLSNRILKTEHKIYPLAVKLLSEDRIKLKGNRVMIEGDFLDADFFALNPIGGGKDGV